MQSVADWRAGKRAGMAPSLNGGGLQGVAAWKASRPPKPAPGEFGLLGTDSKAPIDFSAQNIITPFPVSPFAPRAAAPGPTFKTPQMAQSEAAVRVIGGQIKDMATGAFQQAVSGIDTIREGGAPGRGPASVQGLEAGLKVGAGIAGVIFSPLAPVMEIITKGIELAGEKLADTPLIKEYEKGATETDERVLEALANLGGIAMGILGAKGGEVKNIKVTPEGLARLSEHPEIIEAAQKATELQKSAIEEKAPSIDAQPKMSVSEWQAAGKPDTIADIAYQKTKENGGVTINIKGDIPTDGYAYAPLKETEQVIPVEQFSPQHVNSFRELNKAALEDPRNHVGVWVDGGRVYLDVSRVGSRSRETITEAQGANQLAVYDLGEGRTIPVGQIVDGVYTSIYEEARGPNLNARQDARTGDGGNLGGVSKVPGSEKTSGAAVGEPPLPLTRPVKSEGAGGKKDRLASRVFERMQEENPELKGSLNYDPIKLKEDASKAVDLIEANKQDAFRKAMGYEPVEGVTQTAINIAMSEKAIEEGNWKLAGRMIRNRSLAQTRRGQEISAERGSVTGESTADYVKKLVADRMDSLGKTRFDYVKKLVGKGKSTKGKATEIIEGEVAKLEEQIKTKKLDTKTALSLLDKLACI